MSSAALRRESSRVVCPALLDSSVRYGDVSRCVAMDIGPPQGCVRMSPRVRSLPSFRSPCCSGRISWMAKAPLRISCDSVLHVFLRFLCVQLPTFRDGAVLYPGNERICLTSHAVPVGPSVIAPPRRSLSLSLMFKRSVQPENFHAAAPAAQTAQDSRTQHGLAGA